MGRDGHPVTQAFEQPLEPVIAHHVWTTRSANFSHPATHLC